MKTSFNLRSVNPMFLFVGLLLGMLVLAICASCEKSDVAPVKTVTPITKGSKTDMPVFFPRVDGKKIQGE